MSAPENHCRFHQDVDKFFDELRERTLRDHPENLCEYLLETARKVASELKEKSCERIPDAVAPGTEKSGPQHRFCAWGKWGLGQQEDISSSFFFCCTAAVRCPCTSTFSAVLVPSLRMWTSGKEQRLRVASQCCMNFAVTWMPF
ncbi:glucose-6-phosphate dehydrogenase [Trypanosoma conorhini]|uniref:Glucose-6-phosphate dehydrogenase n=1 Tax=Trypanosoma conorhini TaxID=83891 RepID=A0A422NHQ7_9TRYP|nr:glucose-6-phosphate dehydrogenase [Trypanosoma conorhini]RNF05002.1 glucose-6-phosphate dehydrogenase [Trypanosoma conorhini]